MKFTKKKLFYMQDAVIMWLRVSLGIVFFWFGILKVAGYNPVYDLIYRTFPFFAEGMGLVALGAVEAIIGLMLLTNVFPRVAHMLLVLHLLGTFATFILVPHILFQPYFPVLTLAGEFVIKNLALALSGLVVLIHEQCRGA